MVDAVCEVLSQADPEYVRMYPTADSLARGICRELRFFNQLTRGDADRLQLWLLRQKELLDRVVGLLATKNPVPRTLVTSLVDGFERSE